MWVRVVMCTNMIQRVWFFILTQKWGHLVFFVALYCSNEESSLHMQKSDFPFIEALMSQHGSTEDN